MITWQVIFWSSIFLMLHSYLFFPGLLKLLSLGKKPVTYKLSDEELPKVTILFSAFNEEEVIEQKIESVFLSDYPAESLRVMVGSDASTDGTGEILTRLSARYPALHIFLFEERRGKPAVINTLMGKVTDPLVIMTDANILLHPEAIRRLTEHFAGAEIGAVGANIINQSVSKSDVSLPENSFVSREITMKHREGLIWGAACGLFGGLYAMRTELYRPVPAGFAVDDFFITMNILREHFKVIVDPEAIGYENVSNKIAEEYRRKVRIANGNFKNMRYFSRELAAPWRGKNFAYLSHKVIRWMGPFLLLLIMLSNIFLYSHSPLYEWSFYFILLVCFTSIIDYFLSKIGLHIVFLRFVRHFISMNVALFHGFIKFIKGETYDVWQPTNRK